jgi:GNAT superfamily N-acetyltransferase
MTSSSQVPDVSALASIIETTASWQRDRALVQLHPGDLGWAWRQGASAVAASLRVWSDDGTIVAVGFTDGPTVLRMTVSPERWSDPGTARRVLADLGLLGEGTLFPDGALSVEVPTDTALHSQLVSSGWRAGEAWTPLARDLTEPVDVSGLPLRPEVVDRTRTGAFTSVHRSAWGSQSFTDDLWDTMAGGPAFRNGACILGLDPGGTAVAGVTIWSAGVGRPGLLEPMGVHADHRGRGYGRAICIAAAAELRQRGASTAWVCTPSSLRSAVATYRAAGFTALPERLDLDRPQ